MFVVQDDDGPMEMFPLRPGGPLRFRELTAREMWLWRQKSGVICGGGFWTPEMQALAEAHYDAHAGDGQPHAGSPHAGRKAAA